MSRRSLARLAPALRTLPLTLACLFAMPAPSTAQTNPPAQAISLPAQPLAQALNALARQTRLELVVPQALVAGRTAPAVDGQLTPQQALQRLLAGSGLTGRIDGTVITVQPAPRPASAAQADASAPEPAQSLPTVTVQGASTRTLVPAVGKLEQTQRETPQSLTVISQERIEQQALKTLDDVMLQATGVTREQLWLNNNYYSRGLQIRNIRYDDGATAPLNDRDNSADVAQFEQVSILRGADGLFGAGDAGGVINLRSKRPGDKTAVVASLSAASWNNYRAELDVTGPLSDDRRLKGRVVGVIQDQDHFFKPSHSQRQLAYGALQFDPTPETSLVVGASYQHDRKTAFNASLMRYVDGADAQFDRSTTMGAPWGWLERRNVTLYASLAQQLGRNWKLGVNARQMRGDDRINGAEMEGAISYTTKTSDWWRYQDLTKSRTTLLDANLQGSFEALGRTHDVIVGLDRNDTVKHYHQNWVWYAAGDAFNRTAPPEWAFPANPDAPSTWDTSTRNAGTADALYASLRLRPADGLTLMVGGRQVFSESQSILNKNTGVPNEFKQKNDFIPYAGIVYDLGPQWSVYASRTEIYQSQLNYYASKDGPSLEPATGRNSELGLKGELLRGRLTASIALFDLRKEKEAVYKSGAATGNNAWCCYVAAGNKQSRGVDLELNGQALPGWDVSFGYTYNDNQNLRDGDARFSTLTPRHLFKLWSNHDLSSLLRGTSLGWGVNAQSRSYQAGSVQAYNPATGEFDGAWQSYAFVQGSYALWSLRAAYEIDARWKLSLNLNNVFDKHYFSTVGSSGYGNFYGEPRSVQLTLRASY